MHTGSVPAAAAATPGTPELSPREAQVLTHWLRADSKTAVCEELFLGLGTVNTYLYRIREKYAVAGRPAATKAALLARALQDGLLGIDDL